MDLPAHFDFVLGVPGALAARGRARLHALAAGGSHLDGRRGGAAPAADGRAGGGVGGNARVGLEDNSTCRRACSRRATRSSSPGGEAGPAKGRELATPQQARKLLRLG